MRESNKKKLVVRKETVASLGQEALKKVGGAQTMNGWSCLWCTYSLTCASRCGCRTITIGED